MLIPKQLRNRRPAFKIGTKQLMHMLLSYCTHATLMQLRAAANVYYLTLDWAVDMPQNNNSPSRENINDCCLATPDHLAYL